MDPAELRRLMNPAWPFHDKLSATMWNHVVADQYFDPVERIKTRNQQKVFMARFGRQSVLQWDEVDVAEFLELHDAFAELATAQAEAATVEMEELED